MVPGGNDALVLHALPALQPHAALAYAALVAGAACALLLLRALRCWGAFFRDHGQAGPRPAMRKLPGASSQPALTGPALLAHP